MQVPSGVNFLALLSKEESNEEGLQRKKEMALFLKKTHKTNNKVNLQIYKS